MAKDEKPRQAIYLSNPSRRSFPPFEALRAFDAVAQLGGVRRAARALLRDHAVISRHLRALEEWTGAALLERTPRGTVLTKEGKEYHRQIAEAIGTIAKATTELLKRSEENSVQVWCMPAFAEHWMMGHLDSFVNTNPGLDIELRPTRQMPDFENQEADVAIHLASTGPSPPRFPGAVKSLEIARVPTIAVASPGYLAAHKPISRPADLLRHELLHEEDFETWRRWFAACGIKGELKLSGPRLWHGHLTIAAAREGRGVALSNRLVASKSLESGQLVEIGAGLTTFKLPILWSYHFIARRDRWNARPITKLRDWLLELLAKEL